MQLGIPTLWLPNTSTSTDDQVGRGRYAAHIGSGLCLVEPGKSEIEQAISKLSNEETRRAMRRMMAETAFDNGAKEAAEYSRNASEVAMRSRVTRMFDGRTGIYNGPAAGPASILRREGLLGETGRSPRMHLGGDKGQEAPPIVILPLVSMNLEMVKAYLPDGLYDGRGHEVLSNRGVNRFGAIQGSTSLWLAN